MPRAVAPPPSGEFNIRLIKPYSGTPTHTIEVIGEPNRPSSVSVTNTSGGQPGKKVGDIQADDTQELMRLVSQLRGFPTSSASDIYGLDTKLELTTFDIQWENNEDDAVSNEATAENKETFKEVADSIEALARQFAKKDAAL